MKAEALFGTSLESCVPVVCRTTLAYPGPGRLASKQSIPFWVTFHHALWFSLTLCRVRRDHDAAVSIRRRIKADFVLVSANGVDLERQNAAAAKKIIMTSPRPLTLVLRDTSIVSSTSPLPIIALTPRVCFFVGCFGYDVSLVRLLFIELLVRKF